MLLRFVTFMGQQKWRFGGYWLAVLELDAVIWMKISRPRCIIEGQVLGIMNNMIQT